MHIAWCEVNVNLLPQCQAYSWNTSCVLWGFFNEPDHLFKEKTKTTTRR